MVRHYAVLSDGSISLLDTKAAVHLPGRCALCDDAWSLHIVGARTERDPAPVERWARGADVTSVAPMPSAREPRAAAPEVGVAGRLSPFRGPQECGPRHVHRSMPASGPQKALVHAIAPASWSTHFCW